MARIPTAPARPQPSWSPAPIAPAFFPPWRGCGVATARAGNVIGGGDLSPNRLVPDLVRAVAAGHPAQLRHPDAVRPWQHVLDAVSGYLQLAQALFDEPALHARPWNFGPEAGAEWTVRQVAEALVSGLGGGKVDAPRRAGPARDPDPSSRHRARPAPARLASSAHHGRGRRLDGRGLPGLPRRPGHALAL